MAPRMDQNDHDLAVTKRELGGDAFHAAVFPLAQGAPSALASADQPEDVADATDLAREILFPSR
jgi:hypothetical protein